MTEGVQGMKYKDEEIQELQVTWAQRQRDLARKRKEHAADVLMAKELGDINSSDSEYQEPKERRPRERAASEQGHRKHTENQSMILRLLGLGELNESDEDVQTALRRKVLKENIDLQTLNAKDRMQIEALDQVYQQTRERKAKNKDLAQRPFEGESLDDEELTKGQKVISELKRKMRSGKSQLTMI
ncbi:hypothetical protein PV08_01046 [Exophiala spinifera]|uniref:Uncharacterized protein n=1 Tax=Exophiala spinifera TaxID=91928 RepID=A0A0D1YYW9_9EURO|nr:uncharacterized protein PV08_01046 [Exophiala spinifera]KIW20471.1 hypothetical protein PV08_01046 [Exophiala spinifera]